MIFSVIVPFLNEEKLIERCLNSLLQLDFEKQDYELIFIDNGSTDHSTEIVQQYPVTLLHEPRRDPYLARNRGIQMACGEFIAFTDSDCIVDCYWLTNLYHSFKTSNSDIVIGRLLYPSPVPISLECHEQYYHMKLNDICEHKRTQYYYGHAGNMAIRASVFKQVGLFSGMPTVGDTEIIHKLIQQQPDANIMYESRAEVVHAEVTHFGHYLYKQFEIGQYSEAYSTVSTYRPLRIQDNVRLAKLCINTYHYGFWKMLIFGNTLVAGFLFYITGRFVEKFQTSSLGLRKE